MPNLEVHNQNFEAASVFQTQNSPVVDSLRMVPRRGLRMVPRKRHGAQ